MRYIITIRKAVNPQPTCYYLSSKGFRCYSEKEIAIYRGEHEAMKTREHFAKLMPEFILTVERLPPNVLNVAKALLSAVPV